MSPVPVQCKELSFKLAVGRTFVRFEVVNFKEYVYGQLRAKLDLYKISFPVYFRDRDGDWCGITKEDELIHALSYNGIDACLKLYPTPTTSSDC
ncbi:hypothetical protein PRIPAC_81494 [Pristionchus pacificus]|uniref:Uncharacterized protein n=1 Tax=Pristionchus pacificus TaxID=54126 RepID=A0A2A6BXK6_PRIPA|nr:hypothetical protein PRIPAC_81494 [Pristionchus pacificus]|eukprot:PDM70596.1 hypothetical protein PRIPAC_46842 [Pristionchus pacificus]